MAENNRPSDIVDEAFEALRGSELPQGPTMQALERTLQAVNQAQKQSHRFSLIERIRNMNNLIKYPVAAAILIVGAVLAFWPGQSHSLAFAQAVEALKNAKSVHAEGFSTRKGVTAKEMELWYAAGQGVRERGILPDQVRERLDNGTSQWLYRSDRKSAIKSVSADPIGAVHKILDDHRIREVDKLERQSELDQKINDVACRAYVAQLPEPPDRVRRMVLWLDDVQRPHRIERQEMTDGKWRVFRLITVDYDQPLPEKIFQPDFGPGVEIIDATKGPALDLMRNLLSGEIFGLVLTVHEVYRLDNDAILIAWSLLPSEETRKKISPASSNPPHYGYAQIFASKLLPSLEPWHIQPMDLAEYDHGGGATYWTVLILKGNWSKPVDGVRLSFSVLAQNELQEDLKKNGKPWQDNYVLGDLNVPKETVSAEDAYRKVYGQASTAAARESVTRRPVQLNGKRRPLTEAEKQNQIRSGMRPEDVETMHTSTGYTPIEITADEFIKNMQYNYDDLRKLK